ncbi:LOW QUALITY PROTEIN: BUD13 homolog [Sitophilus oryzae]|uniref:BUD13 homolog n=1 Tax=Sitophilus oryzae TaxID=7048 RepID=A0A6J2YTP9_SITOR|nr:LOW QUALITY PROTEIN: BUD13 homolog [Sitophilus oryzae]
MSVINQKEYLKKYLGIGKKAGEKKKKKKSKPKPTGFVIVDDDIDVRLNEEIKVDLNGDNEDAPQIVSVIDDRPPSLRIDEKTKDKLWIPLGGSDDVLVDSASLKFDGSIKISKKTSNKLKIKTENEDNSPPRRRKGSESPVRIKREVLTPERDDFLSGEDQIEGTDLSPKRKQKSSDDISPPRRKIKVEELSPPRRQDDGDISPPRRKKPQYIDDDSSPPRRKTQKEDISPPRRRKNEDISPPRRRKNVDISPPRRSRNEDISPPRRGKNEDISPPRRRKHEDTSPPRTSRGSNRDMSPPRRSRHDNSPPHRKKKSRWGETEEQEAKLKKTLDGKTAGLQNARDLVKETIELKKKEDELFKNMGAEVSGANAATVVRTKKKDIVDVEEEERKRKREIENKEKYDRWGKGVKQVEDDNEKMKNELHEMSKPLARYADDADLEQYLKEQEREGDPMLKYLRQKKRKKTIESGIPVKQQYEGDSAPNRFGIRPGFRWDGVDRSSGYEKKWFEVQNSRTASLEETYKWSTEDM